MYFVVHEISTLYIYKYIYKEGLKETKELSLVITSIAKRLVSNRFTVHCQVQLTVEQKQSKQIIHYHREMKLHQLNNYS